jgi:hypothetical protein
LPNARNGTLPRDSRTTDLHSFFTLVLCVGKPGRLCFQHPLHHQG